MTDRETEYFLIYLRRQIQTLGEIGKFTHRQKAFIATQLRNEIDDLLMEIAIKKNQSEF